jgi:hypothetical protein
MGEAAVLPYMMDSVPILARARTLAWGVTCWAVVMAIMGSAALTIPQSDENLLLGKLYLTKNEVVCQAPKKDIKKKDMGCFLTLSGGQPDKKSINWRVNITGEFY